jgi:hypothetical protein
MNLNLGYQFAFSKQVPTNNAPPLLESHINYIAEIAIYVFQSAFAAVAAAMLVLLA